MKAMILLTILISLNGPTYAEQFLGGATIVPVRDGLTNTVFEIKTDAASLYLEKAVLQKENGWFTNDKEVAVTAKLNINSQKKNRTSSTLTICRVYKFDVSLYEDGRIEIPLKSLPLLDSFQLSGDDYVVTSVVANIYLSKKREKSGFSKTLETLINVSKKIPVPGNPYIEYASVFGDAFSEVVEDAIQEGAETVPFATFGLRFLQGPKAINFTERPGVQAIILGQASNKKGIVNIESMDKTKLQYDDIAGLTYDQQNVLNNYIIVRVTASTDPWKAMLALSESIKRVRLEAPAALTFSRINKFNTPNLEAFVAHGIDTKDASTLKYFDEPRFEAAIKELNSVKAVNPFSNGIAVPVANLPTPN